MSESSTCIVACTGPGETFAAVGAVAIAQARESGARVIFYDVSHDGQMTDSRPNFWAGEGEQERYDRPLDPIAIEKLGFHDLAVQVQRARDEGIDAFGWLPNDTGGKGLAAYAQREQASLVLLPAGAEITAQYADDLRAAQEAGTTTIKLVDEDSTVVALT